MRKKKTPIVNRARPVFEELEPRLLLNADLPGADNLATTFDTAAVTLVVDEAGANADNYNPAASAVDPQTHELILIDANTPDYQRLVDDIISNDNGRHFEVRVLNSHQDGLDQISQVLNRYQDLDAVHIISHGDDATLQLGNTTLDRATVAARSDTIATWGHAFSEKGDLLIYGCDLAATGEGKGLVDALSRLTKADVAASDDLTGNAARGGDWVLEYRAGQIEADVAISQATRLTWNGILDIGSGLVGHWTVDADASDASGNGNDGVLTGNATIDTSGVHQVGPGRLTLDGNDDYIELAGQAASFQSLTQGTIAGWIKTSDTTNTQTLFGVADKDDNFSYSTVGVYQGNLFFDIAENSTYQLQVVANQTVVADGNWHHVAVTVDSGGNSLYIDGAKVASADLNYIDGSPSTTNFLSTVTNIDTVEIGVTGEGNNFVWDFNGQLDDIRVYDRALDAGEINQLFDFKKPPSNILLTQTTQVTIANPGFESQVLADSDIVTSVVGWTDSGDSGVWNPDTPSYAYEAPEGRNVAYVSATTGGQTLSQVLTETFEEGRSYSLSAWVGDESGGGDTASWEMRLYAGTQLLGAVSNADFNPADGEFIKATLHLDADTLKSFSGSYGQQLKIELYNDDSTGATDVHFDDVQLDYTMLNVADGATNGAIVGDVASVTDANNGDTFSYSLTDNAGGRFAIDPTTGVITVADGSLIDYNTNTRHDIVIRATDQTGLSYDETFTVQVRPPLVTAPATASTNEDTALVFSSANGNAITLQSDNPASTPLDVTLASSNGTLTLAQTTGLTFISGDGAADASMRIQGTLADINAALDGLSFAPDANFNGAAGITITAYDDAGLLGYYSFDDGANLGADSGPGTANNGTVTGVAPTTDATRGDVAGFTRANQDKIDITGLFGEPQNVTLSAWIDFTGVDPGDVISLGDAVALRAGDWGAGADKLSAFFYDGANWNEIAFATNLSGDGWHHIAYVMDDTHNTQTLYLDGMAVASDTNTASISYTAPATAGGTLTNSTIGTHPDPNSADDFHFEGRIDDARIYSRALTASEIRSIMAAPMDSARKTVTIIVDAVNDTPTDLGFASALSINNGATDQYAAASGFTQFPTDALTVEVSFSSDTVPADGTAIVSYASSATSNDFLLWGNNGGNLNSWIEVWIQGNRAVTAIPTANVFDGEAHQLSVTWESSSGAANVYLDGALADTVHVAAGQTITAGGTLMLGQDQDSIGGGFNPAQIFSGNYDEVRIFNVVRTAEEIARNTGKQLTNPATEPGLVSNWRMDAVTGGEIIDEAGSRNLALSAGVGLVAKGTVPENSPAGTIVGKLATTDADSPDTFTYSIVSDPSGFFEIVGDTVRVKAGATLDFETANSHDITVRTTDAAGAIFDKTLTITVTDVNDSPVNTVPGPRSVNEDTTLPVSGISVADDDGNLSTVRLTVSNGTLNVALSGSASISAGANGSADLTLSGSLADINTALGTLTYQGNANFNGSDTLTVLSTDINGATDADTVAITVNAVNDAPVNTLPASITVTEDVATPLTGISIADTDANGGAMQVVLSVPAGTLAATTGGGVIVGGTASDLTLAGTVSDINTFIAASNVTYTTAANASGSVTLTVSTSDQGNTGSGGTLTDSDPVTLNIAAVNDAPTAADNTVTTNEDTAYTFAASDFGFADVDGDALASVKITSLETAGALQLNGVDVTLNQVISKADIDAGHLTFLPAPNANGAGYDSFGFSVNDGAADSASSYIMTIDVTAVNDAPVNTIPVSPSVDEDTVLALSGVSVFHADDNLDSVRLTVGRGNLNVSLSGSAAISSGANNSSTLTLTGSVTDINATLSTLTYQGDADFNGSSTFYIFSTGSGYTDLDSTTITVNAVNDAPVFSNIDATPTFIENGAPVILDSDATISDVDLDLFDNYAETYVAIMRNGGFNSQDRFGFIDGGGLTLSNGQILKNGQSIAAFDQSTAGLLWLQFTDANGETPTHADVLNIVRQITYENLSESPPASISLQWIFDDRNLQMGLAQGSGNSISIETFTQLNITAVNDAPTVATNTGMTVSEGSTTTVIANTMLNEGDVDDAGTGLTYTVTNLPANGTLKLNGSAIALNGTFTQADIDNNRVTYDHDGSQTSSDSFAFTLADGGEDGAGTVSGTFNITITNVNDVPVNTVPASQSVNEDTALPVSGISVADDDGNLSTVRLTVSNGTLNVALSGSASISAGANGSADLTLSGSLADINTALGTLTYQGNANFNGSDTLTVLSTDTNGATDADTVAIAVNAVNDAPVGLPTITGSATEDQTLTADTGGISDADGLGAFSYQWLRDGAPISGATAVTYTLGDADVGAHISVQVSYTDGHGTAEGPLTSLGTGPVANVNDAPTAADDAYSLNEDTPFTATPGFNGLLQNDSDIDGDTLSINTIPVTGVAHGALTLNADGSFSYIPDTDFVGADSFTYQVSDGHGGVATATVLLTVNAANDAPVTSVPGRQNTDEGTPLIFSTATGNAISIQDVDAGGATIELELATYEATLTLATTQGLSFVSGDGHQDAKMIFRGTVADINAALEGLRFDPRTGWAGSTAIQITVDDLGNGGNSGPLTDTKNIIIEVESTATPDIPSVNPEDAGPGSDLPPPMDTFILDLDNNSPDENPTPIEVAEAPLDQTVSQNVIGGAQFGGDVTGDAFNFATLDLTTETPRDTSAHPANTVAVSYPQVHRAALETLKFIAINGRDLIEHAIWGQLDLVGQQMSDSMHDNLFDTNSLAFKTAAGITFTLSAGYVSWLITSGSLTASMLSLAPLWMQFDPIPVLGGSSEGTGSTRDGKRRKAGTNDGHDRAGADDIFE